MTIQVITPPEIVKILNSEINTGKYEPIGLFMAEEYDGSWTAVDNSGGNAWTENFRSKEIARRWLLDELDTETAYELDERSCT